MIGRENQRRPSVDALVNVEYDNDGHDNSRIQLDLLP